LNIKTISIFKIYYQDWYYKYCFSNKTTKTN